MAAGTDINKGVSVWREDCLEALAFLPENSVDSIVTDPPYGLGFMGKAWDDLPPGEPWARACLRVLKPGGHLLAFGGTRTWHRLAVAVEDAGFEIRDSIAWLYGSGFPKSLDVSKAIDKAAGAERAVVSTSKSPFRMADPMMGNVLESTQSGDTRKTDADGYIVREVTAPATPNAERWQGWGTALKPAFEPIVVARKPLVGTVAANVLAHGTGALNIDGCRIETTDDLNGGAYAEVGNRSESASLHAGSGMNVPGATAGREYVAPSGRWPANVILDESQASELDTQTGELTSGSRKAGTYTGLGYMGSESAEFPSVTGSRGGASRFFYVAKAPKKERPVVDGVAHPTVKPLTLMRYLVRLVTPPGGLVLDPFAGTGTTGEAVLLEGFRCLLIEREETYLPLIHARLARVQEEAA